MLPPALATWITLPGPASVLAALRERAERGHSLDAGTLRVMLTEQQRREVARLLGTQWEVTQRPISLRVLSTRLAEHGLTTHQLVEAAGGPVVLRREARAAVLEQALAARTRASAMLADAGIPSDVAEAWSTDPGNPAAEIEDLAVVVATVWRRLPRAGQSVRLARLAAEVLNDAHALDATAQAGRAVARLAAATNDLPRPRSGREWRAAWRSVGVLCDTVSSRVLVLNVPLRGPSPAAAACAASLGEPLWLTQRMLDKPWTCNPTTVFICENPTIVEAAADALGSGCPPMLCTDGIASVAATSLIAGLAAVGCRIIARADFDDSGLTVVDQVHSAAPEMLPWRFDLATYAGLVHPSAVESVLTAASLHDALKIGGPVHEERLLPRLLADLDESGTR